MNFGKSCFSRAVRVAWFGLLGAVASAGAAYAASVAKIGDAEYESLAAAIAAANSGDTVQLLADIDLGTTGLGIDSAKNFTLDIGEYDITGTVNGKLITNNGTLTVNGTTGCVYNQDVSAQGHDAFLNNGTATINGGWFGDSDNVKTNANAINRGASVRNFGTVTINGGHFTACDNYTNGGYAYAIINGDEDEDPTLTINNADVYGRNNGNIANNCGTVTVNGGTYDLSGASSYQSVYSYSGSTVVTNGTFTKSGNDRDQFRVEIDSDNADNPGTIAVSGGSFTQLVPEQYCAEGFIPGEQDPETGLYTVKPGAYVAQVVTDSGATTNKYDTLAAAFTAANAAGTAAITIINDYTLVGNVGVMVNQGSNITLDLNGHTLSQVGPMAGAGYFIRNNGTLTLKDSTDIMKNGTGTGMMTTSAENPDTGDIPGYANNLVSNYGTLTIESGHYEVLTNVGYASYVVDNYSGGTANIIGGKLCNNAPSSYVVRMFLNSTTAENALNIGGTAVIEGSYAVWMQYPNTNANKASLNISGGTINATSGYAVYSGGYAGDASEITVSFSGGSVGGSGVKLNSNTAFKSLEVTGGTYAAFGASAMNEGFISGGTFQSIDLFGNGRDDPYSVLADGYILTDLGNGTYGVAAGSYVAQIVAEDYVTLSAAVSEASDDIFLDMWGFWGMEGMLDADGNDCPQYVPITDETPYRDLAVADSEDPEAWVSAKYIFDNYMAPGKNYSSYQTSYLYEKDKAVTGRYASLASAIAAVPADGTETTIEMIADVAVTNVAHTIAAGKNIVLDLNGKTIDGFCNTGANFAFITNNGTLVIQDSSDAEADGTGDGKLLFAASPAWIWDGSDNYAGSYISDLILNSGNGVVTVRSGYVANMLPGNACYAIDTGNPAANAHIAINVEGGHIWATNTAIRINVRKNGANDYAFHMTDGTVEGVSCAIAVNNSVSGVDVEVIIEGGSIIGWKEPYYGAIDNAGSYGCDLIITGGDFVGGICLVGDSTVDISGGTFNGNLTGNSYFLFDEIESASITDGLYGDLSYWMRPLGVISGGLFATRPFNGYIAPGFFLVDNTDPTTAATYPYAVVPAKAMVLFETDTVTTNYYSSVVEAFTVATGKTVVMLGDETLTNAVTVSSTSTLDLAGHVIDRSNGTANTEDGSVFVVDGGNLLITNSVGSGKITSTSSKGYTLWVKNNGTVSLQDGTVEAASASSSRHAIYVASGTANVSGGLVRCLQNSSAIYILSGAANVTGGEVTTPGTAIYGNGTEVTVNVAHATVSGTGDYSYGIQLAKSSVANITNSVVSGGYAGVGATGASSVANIFHDSTVSGSVNNGVYVSSGGTANIYGGTVTGAANGVYVTKGTANVSGGTITGTGSGSYGILVDNNAGVANVSDGQIAGKTSVAVASGRTGTVSLTGGVYSTEPAATYVAEGYTTVSLEDGWYMVVPGYTYTYPEGGPITDEGLVDWLHGHGNTQDQVDALLTNAKLEEGYCLNCDITQAGAGGSIAITSITLANGTATIGVRLSRTGAYDDGGIKGKLYIYGAETVDGEYADIGATVADDDFSEGNATTTTFSVSNMTARFFRAVVK